MRWIVGLLASMLVFAATAIEPPKTAPAPATAPAQQPPPPAERPAKPDTEPPAKAPAPDAPAPAAEDTEELPPLPPGAASAGPPPARFNPSEKVRADFPVSFPIDI